MADQASASEPEPAPAPPPESKLAPSSGAGSSVQDHLGNICQGLSSGAALVKIGLNRVLSSFKSLEIQKCPPKLTPETPTVTSRKAPTFCEHVFDLYEDCSAERENNCKPYASLVKHCIQLESSESSKATDETTHDPEEDSNMPVPFDLILMAYHGCAEKSYGDNDTRSACRKKYTELLQFLTQTNYAATTNNN